jgi:hypothetical protein
MTVAFNCISERTVVLTLELMDTWHGAWTVIENICVMTFVPKCQMIDHQSWFVVSGFTNSYNAGCGLVTSR